MKVFIRENGSQKKIEIPTNNRPVRIKIGDVHFDIFEDMGMLGINQIEGTIIIKPSVSNVIYLDPMDGC